jgi:thiol-disulfide isomerase/thioredoxin
VELVPVTFDEMLSRIASNKKAKLTMVDAWANWCGPCKENFPHVVEMHKRYSGKGLAVVSLSMDDREKPKQVDEALEFLKEKKAVFTNFLLDEDFGVGFEKLDVGAIPAVFLFGPDGKEVKRFTMDDTENQFTYEEVEKVVAAMLEGKPIPK